MIKIESIQEQLNNEDNITVTNSTKDTTFSAYQTLGRRQLLALLDGSVINKNKRKNM